MSSENIIFKTVTDSYVPSIRSELDVSNALQTLPIERPKLAFIAQKLAAGTATADLPIAAFSEQDVITQSGEGSIGHLTARAILESNPNLEMYNVPIDDGAGTQATGTIVVANIPTTSGSYSIWIGKVLVQVAVTTGDAVNDIAAAINTAIQALEHKMPVTSGVSTATVTLTARNDGLLGNNIPISYKNNGITTTTLTVIQMGSVVAGTVDPDITTALANLETDNYDIILVANNDGTNLGLLGTHLDNMEHPDAKNPAVGTFGYTGVQATFQTLCGTTLNNKRIDGTYLKYSKTTERGHSLDYELGAAMSARIAGRSDPSRSFDNEPLPGIVPPDKAQRLTLAQKNAIIDDGGSPCHVLPGEKVAVVRAVSTNITNANGSPDKALIDITTIRNLDSGIKFLEEQLGRAFYQAKKTDRTRKSVGSIIWTSLEQLDKAERWNLPGSVDEIIVEDDLSNVYQLNAKIPAYVVPSLHNIANLIVLQIR